MLRRMVIGLFAVMLLPYLGVQAMAAEETGTIRVTLQTEEGTAIRGTVTLYRVGERIAEGYRIIEAFGGGIVREEDALSPYLAQVLVEAEGEAGIPRILDADGCAEFSRLEEGLYLLAQTEVEDGYYLLPQMITLPYEGQWYAGIAPEPRQIVTEPPPTGQHPAPILAAMGMVLAGVGLVLCVDGRRRK